jgi:hypothetical protein
VFSSRKKVDEEHPARRNGKGRDHHPYLKVTQPAQRQLRLFTRLNHSSPPGDQPLQKAGHDSGHIRAQGQNTQQQFAVLCTARHHAPVAKM